MGRSCIGPVEGSRHMVTVLLSGANHSIILGSKQSLSSIQKLLEEQRMDPTFTSFCSHVSLMIQALSPNPVETIAISNSHQV